MQLNSAQSLAISHENGPLLIIAGAGTGKTRVITSKIIDLIQNKKIKSDQILALTFTEKAANEMIERIDENMPLGYEELCIKTFHAFSEKILREAGLEIGIDPGFKVLSQVEQWFFFKKNLFNFNLDYYRPLGNPNRFIYDLITHFNKLKDELISPETYLKYSDTLDNEEKSKVNEVAEAYKTYQYLLIKNNLLDFGDLTYYVIKLFQERNTVLNEYKTKYKYILVDEFQDTNHAQYKLLNLLSDNNSNITVVGDDDQSIYKWRGASLSNILKFDRDFPDNKKIVLTKNYRSSRDILNSAYNLIKNNNPDRLEVKSGINKKLECDFDKSDPVEIHHFPNFIQESAFVANKIKYLSTEHRISLNNIAILVRSNNLTHPFIDELKHLSIPYQVRNPKGLLSLEEIKDLVSVVKFLSNPNDDIALLRIMKIDVFEITMNQILDILNRLKKDTLFNNLKFKITIPQQQLFEITDNLKKLFDLLNHLIEFSKKNSVGQVINEFLKKSGYLSHLIKNDMFEEVENINQLALQVAKFERENEDNSVIDFSNYLNLLEEANSTLSHDDIPIRESVQILTAHGAKGLEFDYVFIVNAVNHRFPTSKRRETFLIPDELTDEIFPEGDFHIQEERRLFYVAMTRAKTRLFITYSDQYEGKKTWKISTFVKEVSESNSSVTIEHKAQEDAIKKLMQFKEPGRPRFQLPSFQGNKLSYSQIDTFKTCPLKYNFKYLMKVPTPPLHTTNFGISVHNTLKEFYQILKSGKKVDFSLIKELFEKNWIPYGYENKEHEIIRKEKGLIILEQFFEKNSDPWIIPAFLERPFNLKIGNYLINGRIDRIDELNDGSYEVIDYKTGRIKQGYNIDKDLQLSLYALAAKQVFDISVSKLSLYFLEDNEKLTTTRDDKQLDKIFDDIENSIKEIKESNFSATPGFYCNFCDFKLICPAV